MGRIAQSAAQEELLCPLAQSLVILLLREWRDVPGRCSFLFQPMVLGTLFLLPGFFRSQWGPTYLYTSGLELLETRVRAAMSAYHVPTLLFLPGQLELSIDCAPLFLSLSDCALFLN